MPDLNSLPPSSLLSSSSPPSQPRATLSSSASTTDAYSPLQQPETPTTRSSSISLAAAATMNATDLSRRNSASSNSRGSPRLTGRAERRRSNVPMSLSLNDPSLPPPGALSFHDNTMNFSVTRSPSAIGRSSNITTGDPHHHRRNPSLGEIHQEIEQEQEAQVNRLLQIISTQQLQLEQIRQHHEDYLNPQTSAATTASAPSSVTAPIDNVSSNAVLDGVTQTSENSPACPITLPLPPPAQALPQTSRPTSLPRTSSSRTPPATHPSPINTETNIDRGSHGRGEWLPSPLEIARRSSSGRDESAYYQAEAASLKRENQILRLRIRELERQVNEVNVSTVVDSGLPNWPSPRTNFTSSEVTEAGYTNQAHNVHPPPQTGKGIS